jgi:hypothetical protein
VACGDGEVRSVKLPQAASRKRTSSKQRGNVRFIA